MTTECDSLSDGEHRRPRDDNEFCKCKDGWGGVNCNGAFCNCCQFAFVTFISLITVCRTDAACTGFTLPGGVVDNPDVEVNMTCYKGGETVFNNHQMCDVTSEALSFKTHSIYHFSQQIRRFSICYLDGHLKLLSAATNLKLPVLSNSGLLRLSHFTADWRIALRLPHLVTITTLPNITARKSNVNVCLGASSAAKMVALVSEGSNQSLFRRVKRSAYQILETS